MPGFPNKIIINHGGGRAMDSMIQGNMDTLLELGIELIELDDRDIMPLKDTLDLRDKMKKLCADHKAAEKAYNQGIEELIEETVARIDKALGL